MSYLLITTVLAVSAAQASSSASDSQTLVGDELAAPSRYFLIDLGITDAAPHRETTADSEAEAINDLGEVVGFVRHGAPGGAFIWRNGLMEDLGTFDLDEASAADINNQSQIVGRIGNRAVRWESDQSITDIHSLIPPDCGGPSGMASTWAQGISSSGAVVGLGEIEGSGVWDGFHWDGVSQGFHQIGDTGSDHFFLRGVSDNGSYGAGNNTPIFDPGHGLLPSLPPPVACSAPGPSCEGVVFYAVNDHGDGVGMAGQQAMAGCADLNVASGSTAMAARGINNAGWIVGGDYIRAFPEDDGDRAESATGGAYLWTPGEYGGWDAFQLDSLIVNGPDWSLGTASGINEQGWISGTGSDGHREISAFVLVPEEDIDDRLVLAGAGMGDFYHQNPHRAMISNATPGDSVTVVYGYGPGETLLSRDGCQSLRIDIENPVVRGGSEADDMGVALFETTVGRGVAGETVWVQAVELSTCRVSNWVAIKFREIPAH